MQTCTHPKCDKPSKAERGGLCSMHIWRKRNGMDMDAPPGSTRGRKKPWPERFWEKVDKCGDEECWPWLASLNDAGYGQIAIDGRPHRAHRVSYELMVGPIPDGLVLDHLCRNRQCVNPRHLEPVTDKINIQRAAPFRAYEQRTSCPSGHEYTPENTRIDTEGYQRCRTCERRDSLAGYYRRRQGAKRLDRSDCTHCGKDVAVHRKSLQFAHHMVGQGDCKFGCCQFGDTCAGTLRTAEESAQRIDDRTGLRKWKVK